MSQEHMSLDIFMSKIAYATWQSRKKPSQRLVVLPPSNAAIFSCASSSSSSSSSSSMEQHLRSAEAASSARSIINSIAHPPSTSTRLFHVNSNFTPKTPPLKLYISSHTSSTNHFKIYYYNTRYRLKLRHSPQFAANANSNSTPPTPPPASSLSSATERKLTILACSAVTIALAIANRVLYKLALVPMKEYPFFLAQITTFGYLLFCFELPRKG